MKIIFISLIFIIFLITSVSAKVIISEIMYAPAFDENYNEWIEIYNDGTEDISAEGWKLCNSEILAGYVDHSDNGTKEENGLILKANEYAVITDGGTGTDAYSNFEISGLALHVKAASLCSRLSNTGKEILIINGNNETEDKVNYTSELALDNNKSLQLDGEWCEGIPTAGKENKCDEEDNPEEHELGDNESQSNQTEENSADEPENETTDAEQNNEDTEAETPHLTSNAVSDEENKTVNEDKDTKNESAEKKKVIYQSKNERMKEASIYLLGGLLFLLIVYAATRFKIPRHQKNV